MNATSHSDEHTDLHIDDQRQIWEREYRRKGKIWGNVPCEATVDDGTGIFIDLGCGDGKNLRRISGSKNLRIGLDFSMQSLRISRRDPVLEGVCFVCADALSLPFRDNVIDNADAHHVLGHLKVSDRSHAAAEVYRVLRPGGRLLITVSGRNDFRSQKGREIEPGTFIKGDGIITHFFTREELYTFSPDLSSIYINEFAWTMRIHGVKHQRITFVALYEKI